ncbi:MAG TPA: ABC transporter substrate-binding protein [Rhodoblastus sp.]|nr:ABC transporter substrate-binding protein [Rhodoblastus sp.]
MNRIVMIAALGAMLCCSSVVQAEDNVVKIGLVIPTTGIFSTNGRQIATAVKTFMSVNGDTAGGRKVEVLIRDDAGSPDLSKRLAQELVIADHVNFLAGFGNTPAALAVAPIATQAKTPQVVMVAATSIIPTRSPFIVRSSQTIPQIASAAGDWAAKHNIKRAISIVSDYGPGLDAEQWFAKSFEAGGGKVLDRLRAPLASPEFAPFLQLVKDKAPDAVFVFVPTGAGAVFMRQFSDRGLKAAGVKLLAMSDVMDDELLNSMGDAAIDAISIGPYSTSHDSPENKAFVDAFYKTNGKEFRPNIVAVSAYDGMKLIYDALNATKGAPDGETLVNAMKGASWNSARGPITIDPATRDIVQNIYVRKVERVNGELWNTEVETIPAVRDPAK